jgi:hypothetical protein
MTSVKVIVLISDYIVCMSGRIVENFCRVQYKEILIKTGNVGDSF